MSKVQFQIVLKKAVYPPHFLFTHIQSILKATLDIDWDWDEVNNAISIAHYTQYPNTDRILLRFSFDFSFWENSEDENLINNEVDFQQIILNIGSQFQSDIAHVEGIFRFEDDFMLLQNLNFYKEIYQLEMKIREALNYILAHNFVNKPLFPVPPLVYSFIDEFDGIDFANDKLKREPQYKEKVFKNYMEHEVFHIIFTRYAQFAKGKELKTDKIFDFLRQSADFAALKLSLDERGITDKLNPVHKQFILDLSNSIIHIELLRNEIMHCRQIKENLEKRFEQITNYNKAKVDIEKLLKNFWEQEKEVENKVPLFDQSKYLKNILFSLVKKQEDNNTFLYKDLSGEEFESQTLNELEEELLELIIQETGLKEPHTIFLKDILHLELERKFPSPV